MDPLSDYYDGADSPAVEQPSRRSGANLMKRATTSVLISLLAVLLYQSGLMAQAIELVPVVSKSVSRTIDLPGEFQPYLNVTLHSRVTGFVENVLVDRGSMVKPGDVLIELSAPEMKAQIAEAESKLQAIEADRAQAEAQLAASQSTVERMREAAKTPGAIAGNELMLAEKQVDVGKAVVNSRQQSSRAAQASVDALKTMESYLKITAPFEGVVTERLVHPGALVGPNTNAALLVIQQVSRLRLIVSVPEENVGGIVRGASVPFRVPAYAERTFSGTVARIPRVLDPKSRSMPVELDVANRDQLLAPGMYPTVSWPFRNAQQVLFVPKTSVVTTTERTFVVREKSGKAEWVDVRKGPADGDLIQVIGPLKPGEHIVKRATDELREGTILGGSSK
jgi:membrane fusion protein, multidrug efflux system